MHTLSASFALNMCLKFVFDFNESYIFIINRTVHVFLLDSSLSLRVIRERSSLVKDSINTRRKDCMHGRPCNVLFALLSCLGKVEEESFVY